jgi:mannosyltransferase
MTRLDGASLTGTEKSSSGNVGSNTVPRIVSVSLLLAVFVLGMGLRLFELDADSLWDDEILTALRAQLDVRSLVHHLASAGGPHPRHTQSPLMYLVTRFFIVLCGDSEFILRFQALLFGSLSILLAYKVGETLWSREVGLIGAFLLAINAYHVRYSQEARHYALMVFLALMSLIFLLKALKTNKKRLWLGFVLCTSLSLYNHYFAFLLLPAEVIFGTWVVAQNWLSYRRKKKSQALEDQLAHRLSIPAQQALGLLLSVALIGLSYLPWLPVLQALISTQLGPQGLGPSPAGLQRSVDYLRTVLTDYSSAGQAHSILLLLWLALFVLGLAACGWARIPLILSWTGIPFAFVAVVAPYHFFDPKYVLFILPLYLLVGASGLTTATRFLERFSAMLKRDSRWRVVLTSMLITVFGVLSIEPLSAYYADRKTDWRGAARYLKANMLPGDLVLADGETYAESDHFGVMLCLPFYLERHGRGATLIVPVRKGLGSAIQRNLGPGTGRVWAVVLHRWSRVPSEAKVEITLVYFEDVSVVRLRESSGDVLQDTVSMLNALLDILPRKEAHFDVHLALAQIHLRRRRYAEAAHQVELAALVRPDHPKAPTDLTNSYFDLGAAYEQIGRFEEARAAYEEVLRIDPDHQRARQRLDRLLSP